MSRLSDIVSVLACPDDRSNIIYSDELLICSLCKRRFVVKGNFIDLRAKSSVTINCKTEEESRYHAIYQSLISKDSLARSAMPFGVASKSVSAGFVRETISHLSKYMQRDFLVCDVGAGAGDYIDLARSCKTMFHCDLDVGGIALAQENARAKELDNILFLRCDYFRLPFKEHSLDFVYTVDTVERGVCNDKMLLLEISRVTKNGGYISFDCHTKERLRVTHVIPPLKCYSKGEILELATEFSLDVLDMVGTGFIPQVRIWSTAEYRILNKLAKIARFPPARWLLICKRT